MTLQARISALITAVGADIKTLFGRSLPAGGTTGQRLAKSSNSDYAVAWVTDPAAGAAINDASTTSTTETWSVAQSVTAIAAAKTSILGGASAAYDTLVEIQGILAADDTSIAGLLTAVGTRVDTAASQSFTSGQKLQARTNIDAYGSVELGNPDTDLAALYATAKA